MVFCKNSFIGELYGHFRIYGHTFQKFVRIYGWYLYELNGTTRNLEAQVILEEINLICSLILYLYIIYNINQYNVI